MEEMRRLDGALALWRVEPAPAGLWDAVMSEVEGISRTRGMAGAGDLGRHNAGAGRAATGKVRPGLLLRDLVVAAAVSIVFFWGGVWPAGERMLSAGESINGAVSAYVRFATDVMERASGTTEEYTRKIIFEEWKKNEMRQSPGS